MSAGSIRALAVDRESPGIAPSTRIVFLTNFIPPYWRPVLVALSARLSAMRVLVSTRMEANRNWDVDWTDLDVVIQKTITFNGRWRHPAGFREPIYVHLPIDTVRQLKQFGADVVISGEMGSRTVLAVAYRKLHPKSKLIVWADVAESTEQGRGWVRGALRRALRSYVDASLYWAEVAGDIYAASACRMKGFSKCLMPTDTDRLKCSGIAKNRYECIPSPVRRAIDRTQRAGAVPGGAVQMVLRESAACD